MAAPLAMYMEARGEGSSCDVLVVDDDPLVCDILQRVLRVRGYTVVTVADGLEAVTWLRHCRPRLLVLDLSLPHLDGAAVATALRARYGEEIPIVVISASDAGAAIARRLGALDYLQKPFNLQPLLHRVQSLLQQHN